MPILDIQTINGTTVGYDPNLGKFVPVDKDMLEGGTAAGLASAAGRGFESIMLGAQQLASGTPDREAQIRGLGGDIEAQIAGLEQRQQAGARAAPWTEAVGGYAPDVAAGLAMTAVTGPLGLAATAGGEGALNAMLGYIRPGTQEERLNRAMVQGTIGAVAGPVGLYAGHGVRALYELFKPAGELSAAAVKGATQAIDASEALTSKQMGRIGLELEQGASQIRNADLAGEASGGAQGELFAGGQGRSAGAAEVPQSELTPTMQAENAIHGSDDLANVDVNNPAFHAIADQAKQIGFEFNPGAFTRGGSGARFMEAVNQAAPWRDQAAAARETANKTLLNKKVAESIGMDGWEKMDVITPNDVGSAQARLSNQYEKIAGSLPQISRNELIGAIREVDEASGLMGNDTGQQMLGRLNANAQVKNAYIDPKYIMKDRSMLGQEMAQAYKNGDIVGAETIRGIIDAYDKVIMNAVKAIKNKKVLGQWHKVNEQYKMLKQVVGRGAISPTGDVNPTTLFNNMNREGSSGGFGNQALQGRKLGDPVKDAYVLSMAHRINAPNEPLTGRLGIAAKGMDMLANAAGSRVGQAVGVGGGGLALINSIWGR